MRTYGYVRVSSTDQNEKRQLVEMEKAGVKRNMIFMDKQSGKDFNRPQYLKLKKNFEKGISFIFSALTDWEEIMMKFKISGKFLQKKLVWTSV